MIASDDLEPSKGVRARFLEKKHVFVGVEGVKDVFDGVTRRVRVPLYIRNDENGAGSVVQY